MYIPCFTLPSTWHSIQYIVFKITVWAFINGSWSWHRDFDREPVTSLHEAHKTLEGTCDFVRCKQSFERYICKHIYEVHELSFTKLGWFFMYVDPSQSFKKVYMQTFLSKSALTNVVQRFFFFCNMMYVCTRILHEVLTCPLWILFEPARMVATSPAEAAASSMGPSIRPILKPPPSESPVAMWDQYIIS